MKKAEELKRDDQIRLLEASLKYTDTGKRIGMFTYPNCGADLVQQGLATEEAKITIAGRATLWLLGKAPDQTKSKAVIEFKIPPKADAAIEEKEYMKGINIEDCEEVPQSKIEEALLEKRKEEQK